MTQQPLYFDAPARPSRDTLAQRVAALFRAHPGDPLGVEPVRAALEEGDRAVGETRHACERGIRDLGERPLAGAAAAPVPTPVVPGVVMRSRPIGARSSGVFGCRCALSSMRDSDRRSATRRAIREACACMMARKRSR